MVGALTYYAKDNENANTAPTEEAGTFWPVWDADLGGASPLLCEPAS